MSEQERTINPENLSGQGVDKLIPPEPATPAELDERRDEAQLAHETLTKARSADLAEARANIRELFGDRQISDDEIYLHGSNSPYELGDEVRPGDHAIRGKNGERTASATTSESVAWRYALANEGSPATPRGRVYEVVTSDGKPAERLGPQPGEVNTRSFTVVGVRDVQPGQQGTIPGVNWKEYSPYSDANHPLQRYSEPESNYEEPYKANPNDVPLPGFGDDFVDAAHEKERARRAASGDILDNGMVF